jgi:hypothetical protein
MAGILWVHNFLSGVRQPLQQFRRHLLQGILRWVRFTRHCLGGALPLRSRVIF